MGQPVGHQNGQHPVEKVGPKGIINRVEYVRVLQQTLINLGYGDVAQQLRLASGVEMQPEIANTFQAKVLGGEWMAALQLLPQLISSPELLRVSRFLILKQKYLEALRAQDLATALKCLRQELCPLQVQPEQLHALAAMLLGPGSSSQQAQELWLESQTTSRAELLAQLQARMPPGLLIPAQRLEVLVEQALAAQVAACPYHNSVGASLSLMEDYSAGVESLPTQLTQVLEQHTDEVWHIAFSHNGRMLASASKDRTAIIWSLGPDGLLRPQHVLSAHEQPVCYLAWSPDDSKLLTCSEDTKLRLWDVASGRLLRAFTQHRETVACCCWMPDSRRFLSSGPDKCIFMFDVEGNELQRWRRAHRVQDMVLVGGGSCLVVACSSDRALQVIRLADQQEAVIRESEPVTSICASREGSFLLSSTNSHTVHLWPLGQLGSGSKQANPLGDLPAPSQDPLACLPSEPLVEYRANKGKAGRYVLRSCFGGSESSFVVHGSEDSQVYMWHRDSGEMLWRLEGHTGTVNSVSWNPANPYMLASASDDKTVRIWMAPAGLRR